MGTDDHNLIPPLTFRLEQTVRFDRPIDPEKDFISPGSYEMKMQADDGTEKVVNFDFESSVGEVDKEDPCKVRCMQYDPDASAFEDVSEITEHMLRNILEVIEWNIEVDGSYDDEEDFPRPVEVTDAEFTIINDATGREALFLRIPIEGPITPRCC